MQPYFLPYLGYWQMINAVDKYVVYDDVNFIKGGWINRNNFLIQGKAKLVSIQLDGASSNKLINEISIKDDFSNFMKMIQINYAKAPYFMDICEILNKIISFDKSNLGMFLFNQIKVICEYLNINTEILLSSDLNKNNDLKGKDKVIQICKLLGADTYYNAIGGQELYNKEEFAKNDISLYFLKTNITPYKQLKNEFVGNLSILDVLMFNSPDECKKLLNNYELV